MLLLKLYFARPEMRRSPLTQSASEGIGYGPRLRFGLVSFAYAPLGRHFTGNSGGPPEKDDRMRPTDQTLSVRDKLAYGAGDIASNLFWYSFGAFLMVFYTDVFGLPADTAGRMLMIAGFWAAFGDPVMGAIADRTHTRWAASAPGSFGWPYPSD